jgi:hypothetical protein
MAVVTLTLTDNPDGSFGLLVESDPPFPGPAAQGEVFTSAQRAAAAMMESIMDSGITGFSATGSVDGNEETITVGKV